MTEEALSVNDMFQNPVYDFLHHKYLIGIYKATLEDLKKLQDILGVTWGGTDPITGLYNYYTSRPNFYLHGFRRYVTVGTLSKDIPAIHLQEFFSIVEKPLNITQIEIMELFT